MDFKDTKFYKKFNPILQEFVNKGGDVNNLKKKDSLYSKIKDHKIYDTNGKAISLEEKFTLLGFPRARKYSIDVKADLIKELEEYVANGGDVNDLSSKDNIYKKIEGAKFRDENGKRLPMEQVFSMLGFPRARKYSIDVKADLIKELEEYVANGGDVNDLSSNHKIYKRIVNTKFCDENGKRLTLEESFNMLGFSRARKYSIDVKADLIKELEEYVANGGDVNDLSSNHKIYRRIESAKLCDENGKRLTLEQAFSLLGFPRARKYSTDVRADLIKEIEDYIAEGGTFDIQMKSLPFYNRLCVYSIKLQRAGINLSHEEIIRDDLGFKTFSRMAMRCKGLQKLKEFRKDGFVDDYHVDDKFSSYITSLAESLNIPYYLVITLIADEKLSKYVISADYVKYVQTLLENYIAEYGDLVGIKRKDSKAYSAFTTLCDTCSDGSGQKFSKKEWLTMFGLEGFENRFLEKNKFEKIDISLVMQKLKDKFGDAEFGARDIDRDLYRKILKHATQYAISVKSIFDDYGLNYRGINIKRLNHVTMTEIPYFKEIKALRDKLIKQSGISLENGNTEEECLEAKIKAVQQAYKKYEQKIESFGQENSGSFDDDLIVE